ncbi:uncharacterized protein BDR25DRAFT_320339 [Lindgomyces ingoldianus]|uniref:Uncharacterized protein n=1 Tax=Lindgomyces ingoldianus TaxID=673940 RepID=A0ACB6Q814_9PLEO|nr:uncharacterized protein BDR25DRAFT_320339 [Lindgomyces ingoldianus]KAF2463039.1 hypothetical protein BDR25DRAFT_320339 [Lindgomyces ingoldianus]
MESPWDLVSFVSAVNLPKGLDLALFTLPVLTDNVKYKFVVCSRSSSALSSFATFSSSAVSSSAAPPKPKPSSAPIIGGAVTGALVFLGLIGAGAFFFFTKRRSAAANPLDQGLDQGVGIVARVSRDTIPMYCAIHSSGPAPFLYTYVRVIGLELRF